MVVENRKEKIGEKRMSIVGFEPTLSRRLEPELESDALDHMLLDSSISNFLLCVKFQTFYLFLLFFIWECQKTSLKIKKSKIFN